MAAAGIFPFFNHFKSSVSTASIDAEKDIIEKAKTVEAYWGTEDNFIFIWDHTKERFVYVGNGVTKMLGYSPADYVNENGKVFTVSKFHPAQQNGFLAIYATMEDFYISKKIDLDTDFLCSNNMLYRKSDGSYVQFLQTNYVMKLGEDGLPTLSLTIARDISHLKKPEAMDLIMASPTKQHYWSYNFDLNKVEKISSLTKQEKKVLNLLQTGIDTKEVANISHSSVHTINTHRKNILEKTGCINTTAAITYCKLVGLL